MSLSSLVPNTGTIFSAARTPAAPQPGDPATPIPGTRTGVPPTQGDPQFQQSAAPSAAESQATQGNPLEQYKAKQDTQPNQQQPTDGFQLPTVDQFGGIAKQLSSSVQINPELATSAMRGDATAFNTLLSNFAEQVIQQTLHASTVAGHQLNTMQAEQSARKVTESVSATQAHKSAIDEAVKLSPELGQGLKAKLLDSAIAELRKEYPTAPAELLGREAAKQLGYDTTPQAQQQHAGQDVDWLGFTDSMYNM